MIKRKEVFDFILAGSYSGALFDSCKRVEPRAVPHAGCRRPFPWRQRCVDDHPCTLGASWTDRSGALHLTFLLAFLMFCSTPAALAQTGIRLAWDPNSESNLAGYKVYYGRASRTYGTPIDVGNTTTYTLNLSEQGTYYIAVTAYDTLSNESDFSNEVTAAIGSCLYSISPSSGSHGSGAESGSVSVLAGAGCNWTASSNVSWISITAGSGGAGNGSVTYLTQANTGASARSGILTIAGQTFSVIQSGIQSGGLRCDLNGDGLVTAADVQILVNLLLGTGSCAGACDLNHDGKIDAADLQLLTNVALGQIPCP